MMKLKKQLNQTRAIEKQIDRKDMIYEKNLFNFQQFETIRSLVGSIFLKESFKIALAQVKADNLLN